MKLLRAVVVILCVMALTTGCTNLSTVDKKIIKAAQGKKYTDMSGATQGKSIRVDHGQLVTSTELADDAVLYVHVSKAGASGWGMYLFGYLQYRYRITGFKVEDGIITDWAYAPYSHNKRYFTFLNIPIGYHENEIFEVIKSNYLNLLQTSSDENISSWMPAKSS